MKCYPKFKGICLREGPYDELLLPIFPSMKALEYKGEKYNRVDNASRLIDGGKYLIYLWNNWKPKAPHD